MQISNFDKQERKSFFLFFFFRKKALHLEFHRWISINVNTRNLYGITSKILSKLKHLEKRFFLVKIVKGCLLQRMLTMQPQSDFLLLFAVFGFFEMWKYLRFTMNARDLYIVRDTLTQ